MRDAAIAAVSCGCSTSRPGYAPFFAEPQRYSHVALACISIQTTGDPDAPKRPMTREECEATMAKIIEDQAAEGLRERGYALSAAPPLILFSHSGPTNATTDSWRGILSQAETTAFFHRNSKTSYEADIQVDSVAIPASAVEPDAWLIIVSRAQFESAAARSERTKGNLYGVPAAIIAAPLVAALSPFMAAEAIGGQTGEKTKPTEPNWIQHWYLLVDPRTGRVLWSHWRLFDGEDARSRQTLKATAEDMFEYLPGIPKNSRSVSDYLVQ